MNNLQHKFNDLKERILYYRYVDNWHKHPWLSHIMCRLGRHDMEFDSVLYDRRGAPEGAQLQCFYCERYKCSRFIKEKTAHKKCAKFFIK